MQINSDNYGNWLSSAYRATWQIQRPNGNILTFDMHRSRNLLVCDRGCVRNLMLELQEEELQSIATISRAFLPNNALTFYLTLRRHPPQQKDWLSLPPHLVVQSTILASLVQRQDPTCAFGQRLHVSLDLCTTRGDNVRSIAHALMFLQALHWN